jgi:hypothetical protein
MALNKFIPLSPDPNITRDSDMGMAQFGHLNTIVDYLNGTNALGDLKLDGTLFFNSYSGGEASIIITHSRYNQNPLTYIGGGATLIVGGYYSQYLSTPYNQGYGNTVLGIYASIIAHDNSYFNTVIGYGASVTINEPGNVIMGYGATSSVANATAIGRQTNVSGYNGTAIGIQARTTTTNGFALGNASALLQIGGNFVPTARVHVKGLGATSATTSLLVQNSSAFQLLKVTDDGQCQIGADGLTTFPLQVYGNSGLQIQVGNTFFSYGAVRTIRFINSNNGIPLNHEVVNQVSSTDNSNYVYFRNQTIQTAGSLAPFIGISIETPVNTQTSAIVTQLNIAPIFNLQANTTSGSIQRGIYYNPTITDLRTAKHYGIQTTSGGAYINTASPSVSAALQADSTTQGFLKPRLTTVQKNAILSPAAGLEIYDTDLNRPCFYSGSAWVTL